MCLFAYFFHISFILCVYLCVIVVCSLSVCVHVEVRGQPVGVSSVCPFTIHIVEIEHRLTGLAVRGFMCSHISSAAVCLHDVCRSCFVVWVFLFGPSWLESQVHFNLCIVLCREVDVWFYSP